MLVAETTAGFADNVKKADTKKHLQIASTDSDLRTLQALRKESGLMQGQILHVLMELMVEVVKAAHEIGVIDPSQFKVPFVEQYLILRLRNLGVLTDVEADRAITAADAMGAGYTMARLSGLQSFANERLPSLFSIWSQERSARYKLYFVQAHFANPVINAPDEKKIQIGSTEEDHDFLNLLAKEAQIEQGQVVRILLNLQDLVYRAAQAMGVIHPDKFEVSVVETHLILELRKLRFLSAEEAGQALRDAHKGGKEGTLYRLARLQSLVNSRYPDIRAERANLREMAKQFMAWQAEQAAEYARQVMLN